MTASTSSGPSGVTREWPRFGSEAMRSCQAWSLSAWGWTVTRGKAATLRRSSSTLAGHGSKAWIQMCGRKAAK